MQPYPTTQHCREFNLLGFRGDRGGGVGGGGSALTHCDK